MTRTVVCISHASGAGGEEVGRLVAARLGFLCVDEEIVARAAGNGGIDAAEVADEERRKSLAVKVLNAMARGGGDAWAFGGSVPLRPGEELNSDDIQALKSLSLRGDIDKDVQPEVFQIAHDELAPFGGQAPCEQPRGDAREAWCHVIWSPAGPRSREPSP